MIEATLWALVCLGWVYWLIVWWNVWAFFRRRPAEAGRFTPPVSILKPVKGLDAEAYENFASFCRQDYPAFELLFGVSDASDPVVTEVRRLQREFPDIPIRLIVVSEFGLNPKSSILHELSLEARHEVLVISDSDIRVTPDYLRRVVAPLRDPQIGLVTCPYRSIHPVTLTARLESLYLDTSFLPSAIAANTLLRMRFGLGATMVFRRKDLLRTGGYSGIADYLSDDYHIATRIADLGLRVVLSRCVVSNVLGWTSFRQQWDREVRWARSIRGLRPREYPGLLLTFSTPLSATLVAVSRGSPWAVGALMTSMLLRWLVALRMLAVLDHRETRRYLPWLPVRDGLTALIWCCGSVSRHVTWRGKTYALRPDDRLQRAPAGPGRTRRVATAAVRRLDRALRRWQRIYEFSDHEDCVLRLSVTEADREVHLADGTRIAPGQRIGEVHFWNEHLPHILADGPDLAWARLFQRRLEHSMRELAEHVRRDERCHEIPALRAELPFGSRNAERALKRLTRYFGVEILEPPRPTGLRARMHAFGRNLLLWALIWTFNPGSLKGRGLFKQCREVWVSRSTLIERFGEAAERDRVPAELQSKRSEHRLQDEPSATLT